MKTTRIVALCLVVLAVAMTSLGGALDALRGGEIVISKQHAWHDGMFLMLLAIFLMLL
jgi:hypothetical protein